MNKAELIEEVQRELGPDCSKAHAERVVNAVLAGIGKGLQADRLVPVSDMRGGRVRDIHPMGPRNRILLDGADGAAITVETVLSVDPARTYSVIPDPGSVRAFVRG